MRSALVLSLIVLTSTSGASAQEITEAEFIDTFGDENVAVRALEESLARAEAARKRATTLGNPRVDFWQERPEGNPSLVNWTLTWTPPLDGRYGLTRRAADSGLESARSGFTLDKFRLRRDARQAFAEWSLAKDREEVLEQQLSRVADLADREHERARVGEESLLSARRLRLAEAEMRAALRHVQADYARSGAVARAFRPDLPGAAVPAPVALPPVPSPLEPASSAEVRSLESDYERATLEEQLSGRYWGFPAIQFGWQRLNDRGVTYTGPLFGLSWSVPVLDRAQGSRHEAGRLKSVAEARLNLTRARVKAEVEGSLAAYRTLFSATREASEVSSESDRVIEAASAAFRAGETTLTDLLDSLRAAFAARLREIELRGLALEAHRNLEVASARVLTEGALSPPAVGGSPEPRGSRGWGPRDQQGNDAPTTNSGGEVR